MVHDNFIKENIAPEDAVSIGVIQNNKIVGQIPLNTLTRPELGKKIYSFAALSDIHQTYDSVTKKDFINILNFIESKGIDLVCICGDLVMLHMKKNLHHIKHV